MLSLRCSECRICASYESVLRLSLLSSKQGETQNIDVQAEINKRLPAQESTVRHRIMEYQRRKKKSLANGHHPIGTPKVQGMFIGCAGGVGGVAQGPVLVVKSKNSVMSGMDLSLCVSAGKLNRVSISLSAAV
jgi:hypothetical protein